MILNRKHPIVGPIRVPQNLNPTLNILTQMVDQSVPQNDQCMHLKSQPKPSHTWNWCTPHPKPHTEYPHTDGRPRCTPKRPVHAP